MSEYNEKRPVRRGFIFGAVIVGLLAVIAVVLIVSSLIGGGDAPDASSTPDPSTSPSAFVPAGDASVCGLEAFENTNTVTTAPNAEWVIVGTMAAPEEAEAGPGEIADDGFRSCFARTSKGALYAAANVLAMGSDASLSTQIADRLVVPGPGRDAAMAANNTSGSNGLAAQIAGFKVLSYNGSDSTVDIAFRLNTGELVSFPQKLQWVDGDWKVVLADDGGPVLRPSGLQSLGGYVPWAGVG